MTSGIRWLPSWSTLIGRRVLSGWLWASLGCWVLRLPLQVGPLLHCHRPMKLSLLQLVNRTYSCDSFCQDKLIDLGLPCAQTAVGTDIKCQVCRLISAWKRPRGCVCRRPCLHVQAASEAGLWAASQPIRGGPSCHHIWPQVQLQARGERWPKGDPCSHPGGTPRQEFRRIQLQFRLRQSLQQAGNSQTSAHAYSLGC